METDAGLTTELAGFALLALERRPIGAGILIGLLAIKPHLALLFRIALAAEGRWRSFAAAAATALVFAGSSIIAFGWATMQAFLHNLTLASELLNGRHLEWIQITSVYVSALSLGLPPWAAMLLHVAVAAGATIGVWVAWRSRQAPHEAKMATLSAASLLISPYIFYYDLTWTGLAMAWLAKLGLRRGFRRGEREFLAGAWAASVLATPAFQMGGIQFRWALPLALTIAGLWKALNPDQPHAQRPIGPAATGETAAPL